eukprot:3496364-Amphidinium_carterae.1
MVHGSSWHGMGGYTRQASEADWPEDLSGFEDIRSLQHSVHLQGERSQGQPRMTQNISTICNSCLWTSDNSISSKSDCVLSLTTHHAEQIPKLVNEHMLNENAAQVIECNLRASRSMPFISKTYNVNFIELATRVMVGQQVPPAAIMPIDMEFVAVKASG